MLLLALSSARLAGQTALYAERNGKFQWVRRVDGRNAYVDTGQDKLEPATRRRYALRPAPEFAPCFVSVRHAQVVSTSLGSFVGGDALNRQLEFQATFESSFPLKNVFAVLDLSGEEAGRFLVLREIGQLSPHQAKSIKVAVPLRDEIGSGHYKLHVFADGMEVFHSQMRRAFIDGMLDKMIQQRITGVKNAGPRPFMGPAPEYPAALRRAKMAGTALIELTVDPRGRVVDSRMERASAPAFGESAWAAARQWRFLPQVKAGIPVTVTVEMPFNFTAP